MPELLAVIVCASAALAGYLAIGIRYAARPYVTQAIERHCEMFPNLCLPRDLARERRSASYDALFITLIWPVYLAIRIATSWLAASAPLSAHERRQQVAERDRRIAELERDLGIGE